MLGLLVEEELSVCEDEELVELCEELDDCVELDDELSEELVLDEELELSSDEVCGSVSTPCKRIPSCLKPFISRIAVAAFVSSSRKGTVSLNHSETSLVKSPLK